MAGVICLVLVVLGAPGTPLFAQDDVSIRAQRRKLIPLDRLKVFLEAPKRVQVMQPGKVLDLLGVQKGETVADIGAGTGFFTFYMVERVGPEGKVYAVEIEDELLEFIRGKMAEQNIANIVPLKSAENTPNLPEASCDRILIANTYIYFEDPVLFMKNLRPALKAGGLVAIIEVDAEKVAAAQRKLLLQVKGRLRSEVIREMEDAGFRLRETYDFLEMRFFLIFAPEK
jgi:ubiquinone/menaquinone biosynthesis C-methylase UbiE